MEGKISSSRVQTDAPKNNPPIVQVIRAKVPLAELFKYSTALRSMTSGRGIHNRVFSHYDEVPGDIKEKIIEQAKKDKEEES